MPQFDAIQITTRTSCMAIDVVYAPYNVARKEQDKFDCENPRQPAELLYDHGEGYD
jgi:hypothetical protein